MSFKRCPGCFLELPKSKYHIDINAPHGVAPRCKDCRLALLYDYRQEKLQRRYNSGDESLKICECGAYFKARYIFKGKKMDIGKCRVCRRQEKVDRFKKKGGGK